MILGFNISFAYTISSDEKVDWWVNSVTDEEYITLDCLFSKGNGNRNVRRAAA